MKLPSFLQRKNKKVVFKDPIRTRPHFWNMIGSDPFVDWGLMFFVSAVIALAGAAFGAYIYGSSRAELSSMPPLAASSDASAQFDAHKLANIIAAFDDRTQQRVLLERAYAGPSDPSLP